MHIRNLHAWNLSIPAAKALQSRLAPRVSAKTPRGFAPRFVAGADMSHRRGSKWLYGAVVVLDLNDFTIIETVTARRRMTFPYVPGYLSFREAPVLLDCFRKIRSRVDAALFDGQGFAHPRRFGLACHIGLWLTVPSVGCAKSRLCGTHKALGEQPGARTALTDGNERIGTLLRTRAGSKPLYVSVGNAIALKDAEALVQKCCDGKHRLPEPTRRAHEAVNAYRRATEKL